MIVYRIEHKKDGLGPYAFRSENEYLNKILDALGDGTSTNRHPLPCYDEMNADRITTSHFFGFETKEALNDWFSNKWIKFLYSNDFRVYQYKVLKKKVLFGRKQVAFIKKDVKIRVEISLNEVLKRKKVNV